jgi:hypothetical protein
LAQGTSGEGSEALLLRAAEMGYAPAQARMSESCDDDGEGFVWQSAQRPRVIGVACWSWAFASNAGWDARKTNARRLTCSAKLPSWGNRTLCSCMVSWRLGNTLGSDTCGGVAPV